jgi:hypothetical protein
VLLSLCLSQLCPNAQMCMVKTGPELANMYGPLRARNIKCVRLTLCLNCHMCLVRSARFDNKLINSNVTFLLSLILSLTTSTLHHYVILFKNNGKGKK